MTLSRHGQSDLEVEDEDQGTEGTDRLDLAVSELMADLAGRDPELHRHLQSRLSAPDAVPSGGPGARKRADRPRLIGGQSAIPRAAAEADGAGIAAAEPGRDGDLPAGTPPARWQRPQSASLELTVAGSDGRAVTLDQAKSRVEEVFVRAALERNRFNVSAAAHELGVSRVTLYRHMDRFGLRHGGAVAAP